MTLRRSNSLDDGGDLFLGCSGMTCLECTADRELFVEDVFNRGMHMPHFVDRKSTRLNSSHSGESRMPSSA